MAHEAIFRFVFMVEPENQLNQPVINLTYMVREWLSVDGRAWRRERERDSVLKGEAPEAERASDSVIILGRNPETILAWAAI